MIPAAHVAIMWSLYALAYGLRIWQRREARFRYIGKTIGRLIVASTYWWITFIPIDADVRAVWVRWSLFIFPVIDMIFIAQEYYEERIHNARNPR